MVTGSEAHNRVPKKGVWYEPTGSSGCIYTFEAAPLNWRPEALGTSSVAQHAAALKWLDDWNSRGTLHLKPEAWRDHSEPILCVDLGKGQPDVLGKDASL